MAVLPDFPDKIGNQHSPAIKNRLLCRVLLCVLAVSLCGCSMPWLKDGRKTNENPCVVLALPASGNYSPVAAKIKRGAAEAQKNLVASGVNLRLENINTEDPEWLKKLAALPEMCVMVGGPLQHKKYVAANKAGILQNRAFFTFLPTLQGGEEGKLAWRFFPSPQDQVDAVARFAGDEVNLRSFGALYPNDTYGKRMAGLLEKTLSAKNITLRKASYTPGSASTVVSAVKSLVNPTFVNGGNTPIPQTEFEALFLPDSWKNMDMITNSLIVNGEDRLALLGTTLWEPSLSGKQIPAAAKYELAVFPAAWNKNKAPRQLQGNSNDFWTALGYDFVNFAVKTEMDMRPEAAQITRNAQRAASAIQGMAPIHWNDNGVASQRLYLFQITPSGIIPVDAARYRQLRNAAVDRAALRIQNIRDTPPAPVEEEGVASETSVSPSMEEPVVSTPVMELPARVNMQSPHPAQEPAAPAPAVSNQTVPGKMSPTPVPSYKLRLPAKR